MLYWGLTSSITRGSHKEQETECISVSVPKAINTKNFLLRRTAITQIQSCTMCSDQTYNLLSQRATHLS